MCKHDVCYQIKQQGGYGGIAVMCCNKYKFKNGNTENVVLLGLEKYGTNANKWTLCAGKMDRKDNGCFLKNAAHELFEETKVKTMKMSTNGKKMEVDWKVLDKYLKWDDGNFKWYIHHSSDQKYHTPIFIAKFTGKSSRKLNIIVNEHNNNKNLDNCYKEIAALKWFRLSDGLPIDGTKNTTLSSFAVRMINNMKLLNVSFLN